MPTVLQSRLNFLHPSIYSKMTARNISIAIIFGIFISFILYNLGFRTSKQSPLGILDLPVHKIEGQARKLASHSWEYGTLAEALLELHNPELSVFGTDPFPAGKVPYAPFHQVKSLEYAKLHISLSDNTLCADDSSAADPASLGIPAILLGQSDVDYLKASKRQIDHLLKSAPQLENGAISHRENAKEAWSEFVAMVPPFLAYYAIVSNDLTYMHAAIEQISLYRDILFNEERGLWQHIAGPKHEDRGFWSTGNGWVVWGMARVLAAMKAWEPTSGESFTEERRVLVDSVKRVVDEVMVVDDDRNGLLRNYLGDKQWFGEVSGTTLVAATIYRMASLEPKIFGRKYVDWAGKKAAAVVGHVDERTGIAKPVVNPLEHARKEPLETGSAEGQSFLLLLYAAHRDFLEWEEQVMNNKYQT